MKIEEKINPRLSREVIALLRTRGWTLSRIAHAVEASRTLLTRIEAGTDRFSPGQVRVASPKRREPLRRDCFSMPWNLLRSNPVSGMRGSPPAARSN